MTLFDLFCSKCKHKDNPCLNYTEAQTIDIAGPPDEQDIEMLRNICKDNRFEYDLPNEGVMENAYQLISE